MGRFRDAITGLFTTRKHAEAKPETTIRETIRRGTPRGRRIHTEELSGLNAAALGITREAIVELIGRSDRGNVINPADALRDGDAVVHKATFGRGLTVTVAVQVEVEESPHAGQADR